MFLLQHINQLPTTGEGPSLLAEEFSEHTLSEISYLPRQDSIALRRAGYLTKLLFSARVSIASKVRKPIP